LSPFFVIPANALRGTGAEIQGVLGNGSRALNDENTIKELKEDFALGGFSMKMFYTVEAAMVLRVLAYNLFVLFRHEFLGRKEKRQHLKTLRYKYFVLPAQLGSDGREAILRISAQNRKVRSKISYLLSRIGSYIPRLDLNCTAVGYT
jgi:hypothetical protein